MYAKLVDGALEFAPSNYKLPDGRTISGVNNHVALMKKYGFKEVIDVQPEYDVETEYLITAGYEETDNTIVVTYSVNKIATIDTDLSNTEKIEELKKVDTEHELAIAQLTEIVMGLIGDTNDGGVE